MARIRTIKPEFWSHEGLSMLPEAAHMLAAALLNYADDEGYFNANPGLVKAACSPLREPSVNIHESLVSLQHIGYIELGTGTDGRRYGRIVHFLAHQVISRPSQSKISILPITWDCLSEDSVNTHGVIRAEQGTGKWKGNGKEQGKELRRTTTKNHESDHEPSAKTSKRPPQLKRPDDVTEETWMAFVALRKAKRAPLSDAALNGIRREADKAKVSLNEALETCCMRGWQGLKAEWLTDDRGGGQRVNGNAAPNSYVGLAQKDYGKTRMGGFLERVMSAEMKAKLNGGDK